jgi:hypothetical protein
MKALVSLLFVLPLAAQDTSVYDRTRTDINGARIADGPQIVASRSPNSVDVTERLQSINGRTVPIEKVEERLVQDDKSDRITERVIRPYDRNGNPLPVRKQLIEEKTQPDGSSTIQSLTYNGDINGEMRLTERTTTNKQKSGATETAETVIERPDINGGIAAAEKRSVVKVAEAHAYQESSVTYRKSDNGGFYEATRQTTEHTDNGSQSTDSTAEYERGATGEMQLHGQTVTTTVKQPDGSEESQVDTFGRNAPGMVDSPSNKMKLQFHEIVQRQKGPGNEVMETRSLQQPLISDPDRLSPPHQVSQTICRGKCE